VDGGEDTHADGEVLPPRRRRAKGGWAAFDRAFYILMGLLVAVIVIPIVVVAGVAAISNPVVPGVLVIILGLHLSRRAARARDARRHRLRAMDDADLREAPPRRVRSSAPMLDYGGEEEDG